MSTHWEAFGALEFPNAPLIASWRAAPISPKALAAVAKLARSHVSDGTVEAALAAYRGSRSELVQCEVRDARVEVSYLFDGDLLREHGAALFGALASSAAFGAIGTIYIEDTGHMAYILTLDGRSAVLAKWPKGAPAPREQRATHQARVEVWSRRAAGG